MKLGVLGAGQLARMIALAGFPLGVKCALLDPAADSCAGSLGHLIVAPYDDAQGLSQLATVADCVTFEFENVPAHVLESLVRQVPVYPPPRALLNSQDRLREKKLFRELSIPTAPCASVGSLSELNVAVMHVGLPAILKSRMLGYDGKGQVVIRNESDIVAAWEKIGNVAAILEGFVKFDREVSIIAVRARSGETRFYPLVENVHRDGMLHMSTPRPGDVMQVAAQAYADKLLGALDYVGVLAIELFDTEHGLLANEFAPRVHNSGHWTIEGAYTSQFENHLRAVLAMPLGDTDVTTPCAMINLVGEIPHRDELLKVPGAHLHLYDKPPRAGRKIGHITVCAPNALSLPSRVERVLALIECN